MSLMQTFFCEHFGSSCSVEYLKMVAFTTGSDNLIGNITFLNVNFHF